MPNLKNVPAHGAISYCTTCANRSHQLKRVFDDNLEALAAHPDIEWIVLNYGSTDDLHEFILSRLPSAPSRLVYARLKTQRVWHASVAKNVAHRLGRGACLMNLDADNLIADSPEVIADLWSCGVRATHLWSGIYGDGTCGRIALDHAVFEAAGGYDESFLPMGFQDRDLLARVAALGWLVVHAPTVGEVAIRNTKTESIRLCRQPGCNWKDYDENNMKRSLENIGAGRLVANGGRSWGRDECEIVRGGGGRP